VTRIITLAALALLASCPHRGATSARGDSDGEPGDAVEIPIDPQNPYRHRVDGTIGPASSDATDWLQLELPPAGESTINVSLLGDGLLGETYDGEGQLLAPLEDIGGGVRSLTAVRSRGRLLIRVTAPSDTPPAEYSVIATITRTYSDIDAPTPCDPDAYDASNPRCDGECDYSNPDPDNPKCCAMWEKCRLPHYPYCGTSEATLDGDSLWIPLGLENGIFGKPASFLRLTKSEPPHPDEWQQRKRSEPIRLMLRTLEKRRSQWAIMDARVHDLPFVRDHIQMIEIYRRCASYSVPGNSGR